MVLGAIWLSSYLQSAKAGKHVLGQRYEGSLKYIHERGMPGTRFRSALAVPLAIVETKDKREIIVNDPAQRFSGCNSGDDISYQLEDSAVRGVYFVFISGSCSAP